MCGYNTQVSREVTVTHARYSAYPNTPPLQAVEVTDTNRY